MLSVATLVLVRPNAVVHPEGTQPFTVSEKPQSFYWLVFAGFYGGFVQAGVGFLLLATFTGVLRYDLVSSNALKLLSACFFTGIALIFFIYNDQILWVHGLILATGTMTGAVIGVKLALNIPQKALKWFLFIMTLVASIAALFTK